MTTTIDQDESLVHTAGTLEVSDRASDYLRTLDRMIRLTSLADSKAAPLLAVQATLAAVAATQFHKIVDLVRDGNAAEIVAALLLGIVYVSCTVISTASTLSVFLPKDAPGQNSLLFFADIAHMPLKEFVERSMALSDEDLERDALEQTHIVARLAAVKFQQVRRALLIMIGALIAWLGLMALANY
jgi:Family of unknown function (DUF5706)